MKLYFYILKGIGARYIELSECEVMDYPKSYKPVSEFPDGVFRMLIMKSEIGHIIGNYYKTVVLTEKNNKLAKELFRNYYIRLIKEHQKEIDELNGKLKAVEELED